MAKDVLLIINRTHAAEKAKNAVFVPDDLDFSSLTLTFELVRATDHTRLPCEFGTNMLSGSRDILYKKSQRAPKTEPSAVHYV